MHKIWFSYRSLITIVAAMALAGCSAGKTPYATSLQGINEEGSDVEGIITISDPQLYSRENLINDRRRERLFLTERLKRATNEEIFGQASISRNLSDLLAVRSETLLGYNPANVQSNQLQQLKNERNLQLVEKRFDYDAQLYDDLIAAERRKNELDAERLRLKNDIDTLQAASTALNPKIAAASDAAKPALTAQKRAIDHQVAEKTLQRQLLSNEYDVVARRVTNTRDALDLASARDLEVRPLANVTGLPADVKSDELQKQINGLKGFFGIDEAQGSRTDRLAKIAGAQDTDRSLTPTEKFRELQAFRNELRSAISEVSLDDLHDYRGNALYRMNFTVTTAPAKVKNKYGVAMLEIEPPSVDNQFVDDLYFSWIRHLAKTSNSLTTAAGGDFDSKSVYTEEVTSTYRALGFELDLFDIVEISFNELCAHVFESCENEIRSTLVFEERVNARLRQDDSSIRRGYDEKRGQFVSALKVLDTRFPPGSGRRSIIEAETRGLLFVDDDVFALCRPESLSLCNESIAAVIDAAADIGAKICSGSDLDSTEFQFCGDREQTNIEEAFEELRVAFEALDTAKDNFDAYVDRVEFSVLQRILGDIESTRIVLFLPRDFERYFEQVFVQQVFDTSVQQSVEFGEALDRLSSAVDRTAQSVGRYVFSSFAGVEDAYGGLGGDTGDKNQQLSRIVLEVVRNWRDRVLKVGGWDSSAAHGVGRSSAASCGDTSLAPQTFRDRILDDDDPQNSEACTYSLRGDVVAYGTAPTEQGQNLSTIANSARSLEVAFAASAEFPLQGLSAKQNVGFLRDAAGVVEAMERLPRIVGFSDRSDKGIRQFGWVIGPKPRLNPDKQEIVLEQTVSAFKTSAELSFPGWWPSVTMRAHSYWAGSFNARRDLSIQNGDAREFEIPIPTNVVDYGGLSIFLAGDNGPRSSIFRRPRIEDITPGNVAACSGMTRFVIRGQNVWRSTEVYIGGARATDIEILPNMEGIAVTLDIRKDLLTSGGAQQLQLRQGVYAVDVVVATRDGIAPYTIELVAQRGAGGRLACSQNSYLAASPDIADDAYYGLRLPAVSPQVIYACQPTIDIAFNLVRQTSGARPESIPVVTLNGVPAVVIKIGSNAETDSSNEHVSTWRAHFSGSPNLRSGHAIFTVARDGDIVSQEIAVRSCQGAEFSDPGGGAVLLRPFPKWVADGSTPVRIYANKFNFLLPQSSYRIAFRPVNRNAPFPWAASASTTYDDSNKAFSTTLKLEGSGALSFEKDLANGQEIEFSVEWDSSAGKQRITDSDDRTIVYYATPAQAGLSLRGWEFASGAGRNEPVSAEFSLPMNHRKSFPNFAKWAAYIHVSAKIQDGPKLAASEVTPSFTTDGRTMMLHFKFSEEKLKQVTAAKAANKAVEVVFEYVIPDAERASFSQRLSPQFQDSEVDWPTPPNS